MTWRVLLLGLLLSSLNACVQLRGVERGVVVPYDELHRERRALPARVRAALDADRGEEAFYVLEALKSQRLAALLTRSTPPTDLAARVAARDGEGERTRGIRLVPGKLVATSTEPSLDAFWREQEDVAEVIGVMRERPIAYELSLRDRYVITTAQEAQLTLRGDQLLISYFVDDHTFAFVLSRTSFRVVDLGQTAALRPIVTALLERLRDPTSTDWTSHAAKVRDALLGPFASEVAAASALTVVPDGFVGHVPFGVLPDADGEVLLARARVAYVPSASFQRSLAQKPLPRRPPRMLAVGNPAYPVPVEDLAAAENEARILSTVFEDPALLLGEAATERRFYDLHRSFNVFHFATHGVLADRAEADASSLLLAPGPSDDGFLSAAEISQLDLHHGYLAVLSACETAVTGDGESLDSISAAFLAAGVPTILGSLWSVSDASTARLMLGFYPRFLELGAGEALRAAKLALREEEAFRHPYYWAAFALYGGDT